MRCPVLGGDGVLDSLNLRYSPINTRPLTYTKSVTPEIDPVGAKVPLHPPVFESTRMDSNSSALLPTFRIRVHPRARVIEILEISCITLPARRQSHTISKIAPCYSSVSVNKLPPESRSSRAARFAVMPRKSSRRVR